MNKTLMMFAALAAVSPVAMAATPTTVLYNGVLLDEGTEARAGTYQMVFELYDSPRGGQPLATTGEVAVEVQEGGGFSHDVGSLFLVSVQEAWLQQKVRSHEAVELEALPRIRVMAQPFAVRASIAEEALAVEWSHIRNAPQSLEGPMGPQGPQGERGEAGATGPQGEQGPQGERGEAGLMGPMGPQGAMGPQGERGEMGPMGPQGPRGEPGLDGRNVILQSEDVACSTGGVRIIGADAEWVLCNGLDGLPGQSATLDVAAIEPGIQCLNGGVRITSERGEHTICNGLDGIAGRNGAEGPQGPQGPIGPQGERGEQGPQGIAGATGPTGPMGPQGPMGPVGPMGPMGPMGVIGPMGPAGISVTTSAEVAGSNCAFGGVKVTAVNGTQYVCNGNPGSTTTTSTGGGTDMMVRDAEGQVLGRLTAITANGPTVLTRSGYQVTVPWDGSKASLSAAQMYFTTSNCSGGTYWVNTGNSVTRPMFGKQVNWAPSLNSYVVPASANANGIAFSESMTGVVAIYNGSSGCTSTTTSQHGWRMKTVTDTEIGLPATIIAPLALPVD